MGNPHEISVLDLAELIRDLTASQSGITFIPRPQDDQAVRRPDMPVRLRRTIAWFRTHAETAQTAA